MSETITRNSPPDWCSVAFNLAERNGQPTVVLDFEMKIRLFNGAMEQLLGWKRYEVIGRRWADACTPPGDMAAYEWCFDQAMHGALQSCDAPVLARDGRRLQLTLSLSLAGKGDEQCLIASVTASAEQPDLTQGELTERRYVVSTTTEGFGLIQTCKPSSVDGKLAVGRRCHEVFFGRASPCHGCPLPEAIHIGGPATAALPSQRGGTFELVSAEPIDATSARISVCAISHDMLSLLLQAKIQDLAERARLSERERNVLHYLLLGRSVEEIAGGLGITARTVKFHQANLLEKLGADSRIDLMRLLL